MVKVIYRCAASYLYPSETGQWKQQFLGTENKGNISNFQERQFVCIYLKKKFFFKTKSNRFSRSLRGSFELCVIVRSTEGAGPMVLGIRSMKMNRKVSLHCLSLSSAEDLKPFQQPLLKSCFTVLLRKPRLWIGDTSSVSIIHPSLIVFFTCKCQTVSQKEIYS